MRDAQIMHMAVPGILNISQVLFIPSVGFLPKFWGTKSTPPHKHTGRGSR